MSSSPILTIDGLTLRRDDGTGSSIINDFSLDVHEGEVIVVKGESGSGKTTLLKCIAELVAYDGGSIELYGKPATEYGIANYRTLVQYVPQRPSLLPGTPRELLSVVKRYASRKESRGDPIELASEWGIVQGLWKREWATLSGGEGQRLALAISAGLGADILLLDEPTSALDSDTAHKVEKSLEGMVRDGMLKAMIWITHEASQAERIATRTVEIGRQ